MIDILSGLPAACGGVTPPASGSDARAIYESLKAGGILVRYFEQDRLRDKLRITIGTPEQNNVLLAALFAANVKSKLSRIQHLLVVLNSNIRKSACRSGMRMLESDH